MDWTDGVKTVFSEVITDLISVQPAAGVTWDGAAKTLSSSTPGTHAIAIVGQSQLASVNLDVAPEVETACTKLTVVPACEITMDALAPANITPGYGQTTAQVSVNAFLGASGQTCAVQVIAAYADGSVGHVTGHPEIVVTSDTPTVVTSTSTGLLTAQASGDAVITATWISAGLDLCTGQHPLTVFIPAP